MKEQLRGKEKSKEDSTMRILQMLQSSALPTQGEEEAPQDEMLIPEEEQDPMEIERQKRLLARQQAILAGSVR